MTHGWVDNLADIVTVIVGITEETIPIAAEEIHPHKDNENLLNFI